jgi:hypothetical protein
MRVRVLIKHKTEPHWHSPDDIGRVPESNLQRLLVQDPALIPLDIDRQPVVMVDEFWVESGFVDLVGVGTSGWLTVGECKKQDNVEIKRTVVGQLFAYAGSIWGMTYEAFDEIWQASTRPPMTSDEAWAARRRPPLAESVRLAAEARSQPFDEERFRQGVAANLASGDFTLLIAVDQITEELQRTIEYLSGHMHAGVDVIALELGYVSHGDVEVLVPLTFGVEIAHQQRPVADRTPIAPDEASFLEVISNVAGDSTRVLIEDLLAWAAETELLVWYGEGTKIGTLNAGLMAVDGRRRPVVAATTSALLEIEFNHLKLMKPYDDPVERRALLHRLAAIEGVERPDRQADAWPQLSLDRLAREGLRNALGAMSEAVSRIRAQADTHRPAPTLDRDG